MALVPITANTPKGVDISTGIATIPGAYVIKQFKITNKKGDSADIQKLVRSFSLTEELFSPVIILNARIHDNVNFFEQFGINGQETIDLTIEKSSNDRKITESIELKFAVKEYPNYEKSTESLNSQEYTLIGIPMFAYTSALKKISRSIRGNPVDSIQSIFKNDLNQIETEVKSQCVSVFDGIINIQEPLSAVEWIRSRSFDVKGGPFFVFNRITKPDTVVITSYTELMSKENKEYNTYRYSQLLKNASGTPEAYAENRNRVLSMRSNIKLDKLKQAMAGAFSNVIEVTDIATKQFYKKTFDIKSDLTAQRNNINQSLDYDASVDFARFQVNAENLAFVSRSRISTNSMANDTGNFNSMSGPVLNNLAKAKSYMATLEVMSHEIDVYGDFALNPSRKIKIEVPKATYVDGKVNDELDASLSGTYVISVAIHTFSEGIYTSKLKIIRDAT